MRFRKCFIMLIGMTIWQMPLFAERPVTVAAGANDIELFFGRTDDGECVFISSQLGATIKDYRQSKLDDYTYENTGYGHGYGFAWSYNSPLDANNLFNRLRNDGLIEPVRRMDCPAGSNWTMSYIYGLISIGSSDSSSGYVQAVFSKAKDAGFKDENVIQKEPNDPDVEGLFVSGAAPIFGYLALVIPLSSVFL